MTIITKSLRNNNQITKVTEFQADAIFWSKKCAIFKKKENGTKTNNKDFSRADLTPNSLELSDEPGCGESLTI